MQNPGKLLFPFLISASVCFFSCLSTTAQTHKIDSLTQALKKHVNDTIQVINLNKLSYEYENLGSYPIADSLALKALQLGTQVGHQRGIALAYNQIGSIAEDLGN